MLSLQRKQRDNNAHALLMKKKFVCVANRYDVYDEWAANGPMMTSHRKPVTNVFHRRAIEVVTRSFVAVCPSPSSDRWRAFPHVQNSLNTSSLTHIYTVFWRRFSPLPSALHSSFGTQSLLLRYEGVLRCFIRLKFNEITYQYVYARYR